MSTLDLRDLHESLRGGHILFGFAGLVAFWIPAFARKGSRLHVRAGRAFSWLAYGTAATATVSSIWGLAAPVSFAGIDRPLSVAETATLSANIRFLFAILLTVMTWLVAAVAIGSHASRERTDFRQRSGWVRFCVGLMGLVGVAAVSFGGALVATGQLAGFVHGILGTIGIADAIRKWQILSRPPRTPHEWRDVHLDGMLSAGAAMHTAFLVFGAGRLFGISITGPLAIVPWVLPGVLFGAAISRLKRRNAAATKSAAASESAAV